MNKIFDFIKKERLFIIINLIGAVCVLMPVFYDTFFHIIEWCLMPVLNIFSMIFFIALRLGIPGVLAVNIIAYLAVEHDKNIAGLILSLFGSGGAFIGILSNREYKFKKAVMVIFNIQIWIIGFAMSYIWFVASHF